MPPQLLSGERLLRSTPAELYADDALGLPVMRPGWRKGSLFLTDLRLAFREEGPGLRADLDLLRQVPADVDAASPDAVLMSAQRQIPFGAHPVLIHTDDEGGPAAPGRAGSLRAFRGRWLGLVPWGPEIGLEIAVRHTITGETGRLRLKLADPAGWLEALTALTDPPAPLDERLSAAIGTGLHEPATVGALLDRLRFPSLDWVHPESVDEALEELLADAETLGIPLPAGTLESVIQGLLAAIPADLQEDQEEAWVHRQVDTLAAAVAASIPDGHDHALLPVHPVPGADAFGTPLWLWLPADQAAALLEAGVIRRREPRA